MLCCRVVFGCWLVGWVDWFVFVSVSVSIITKRRGGEVSPKMAPVSSPDSDRFLTDRFLRIIKGLRLQELNTEMWLKIWVFSRNIVSLH